MKIISLFFLIFGFSLILVRFKVFIKKLYSIAKYLQNVEAQNCKRCETESDKNEEISQVHKKENEILAETETAQKLKEVDNNFTKTKESVVKKTEAVLEEKKNESNAKNEKNQKEIKSSATKNDKKSNEKNSKTDSKSSKGKSSKQKNEKSSGKKSSSKEKSKSKHKKQEL